MLLPAIMKWNELENVNKNTLLANYRPVSEKTSIELGFHRQETSRETQKQFCRGVHFSNEHTKIPD